MSSWPSRPARSTAPREAGAVNLEGLPVDLDAQRSRGSAPRRPNARLLHQAGLPVPNTPTMQTSSGSSRMPSCVRVHPNRHPERNAAVDPCPSAGSVAPSGSRCRQPSPAPALSRAERAALTDSARSRAPVPGWRRPCGGRSVRPTSSRGGPGRPRRPPQLEPGKRGRPAGRVPAGGAPATRADLELHTLPFDLSARAPRAPAAARRRACQVECHRPRRQSAVTRDVAAIHASGAEPASLTVSPVRASWTVAGA